MWVGSTIRRGSYRHPSALLSHYCSLWHLVFTVLASVENGELYLGSQCAQWPYGNGTQRRPCESQRRKMPSATQEELSWGLCPMLQGGESQTCPPWGKDALLLVHRLQSIRRPSLEEFPKNRYLPALFWVTKPGSLMLFSNRDRGIAFTLFKHHLIYVTVLGEGIRGRCSPFKHNALTVLFVGLPAHWLGHSPEIFGKEA